MSVLCRGVLAMVLGVCVLQAAADSYKKISEWPGTMRGEPFDMKPHGDYLYASMNGQGILNVMDAGTVEQGTPLESSFVNEDKAVRSSGSKPLPPVVS